MFRALHRFGSISTRALALVGLAALMFLALLTLADGLLRWTINAPIDGVRDLGGFAIAIAISCCIPIGLMEQSNISLRLLGPMLGQRVSVAFDAVASILVGVMMFVVAWRFWVYAGKLAAANETTWVLMVPVAPFWYAVSVILAFGALIQCIVIVFNVMRAIRSDLLPPELRGEAA